MPKKNKNDESDFLFTKIEHVVARKISALALLAQIPQPVAMGGTVNLWLSLDRDDSREAMLSGRTSIVWEEEKIRRRLRACFGTMNEEPIYSAMLEVELLEEVADGVRIVGTSRQLKVERERIEQIARTTKRPFETCLQEIGSNRPNPPKRGRGRPKKNGGPAVPPRSTSGAPQVDQRGARGRQSRESRVVTDHSEAFSAPEDEDGRLEKAPMNESPNQPTNAAPPEEHPDLEPRDAPPTIFEAVEDYQQERVAAGYAREDIPPRVTSALRKKLPWHGRIAWRVCFRRYFDREMSKGSRFEKAEHPLAMLLSHGVFTKKMPREPERGFLCMHCREPANELKMEGRAICYPCFGRSQRTG